MKKTHTRGAGFIRREIRSLRGGLNENKKSSALFPHCLRFYSPLCVPWLSSHLTVIKHISLEQIQ